MPLRTTHTYAILAISQAAFNEIHAKLSSAEYTHLLSRDGNGRLVIQMEGVALAAERGLDLTVATAKPIETVEDETLAMVDPMTGKADWYPIVPGTVRGRIGLVSSRTFNDGSGKGKLYSTGRLIGMVSYADGIFRFKEPVRLAVLISFKFKA
jgi:hypothetical protein